MSTATIFKDFVSNLRITNHVTIEDRYSGITRSLNKYFRKLDSTANNLQVGSYGRWTAIKGVSDLDMLYIMPNSDWDKYNKEGGQSKLLSDTKTAIQERYSTTAITVDRLVVCVKFLADRGGSPNPKMKLRLPARSMMTRMETCVASAKCYGRGRTNMGSGLGVC